MDYITRHIGPDTQETEAMLAKVGYDSLEALTTAAIPADLLLQRPLNLPAPLTEYQAQDRLRELVIEVGDPRAGVAAGRVIQGCRDRRMRARAAYPDAWKKAETAARKAFPD